MLVVGLEQSTRSDNPFRAPHIAVDQRRNRTRLLAQPPLQARPHQRAGYEPAVSFAEHLLQQSKTLLMPLQTLAGCRVPRQIQPSDPGGDITSGGVDPVSPLLGSLLAGRRLWNPFHVENSAAQPENWRDEAREPVPGQKPVIAKPSPTDALGQDVADFRLPVRRPQVNFVNPLESGAAHIVRA